MVPGGVAHQHFNLEPGVPALWMRVGYTPHKSHVIANWIEQLEVNPEWADKKGLQDRKVAPIVNHARTTNRDDSPRGNTLFDALFRLRDEQREQMKHARMVVQGKSLPLESNPMGLFRWYVHPDIKDVASRAQMIYVQEIPGGSRSGKQLHQGGRFHYVLEGKGSTVIDGVCHDWEENEIILLPLRSHGVVHQHYNSDPSKPARLLVSEPNWVHVWGVDLGSGLEMLEPAPEYKG
jgi:gentisate 1,2-dioxygenase